MRDISVRRLIAHAVLLALATGTTPLQAHGPQELGEPSLPLLSPTGGAAAEGPSGTLPRPPAKAGQTLPLTPARKIRFDTSELTAASIDLSPDGRTIVLDMLGDIYVMDAKGGEARPISRGMAYDSQPAFSPDGRRILFLSDRSGAENLWVMDADGGDARQLSFYDDDPIFVSPVWSSDGKTAWVSRFWPDRNAYEGWRFATDGSDRFGTAALPNWPDAGQTEDKINSLGLMPSADGRLLYYARLKGSPDFDTLAEWQIARRDLATGIDDTIVKAIGDIRLGPVQSSAFRPVLSHDGRTLAYGMRRVGRTFLHVRDLGSGMDRELIRIDHDELQASAWSDIIPHFAFTPDDKVLVLNMGGGISRIDIASGTATAIPFTARIDMDLAPLTRRPIRQETGPVRARLVQTPALSPDGRTVAFSALGHVYTAPVEGSARPQRIDADETPQFHPSWSPDGKRLLYVTWTAQDGGFVWEKPLDGGPARRLTDTPAFYTHPVFTPDGASVLVIRSPQADRLNSYVEFGQLRSADLVRLGRGGDDDGDSDGEQVVLSGRIGGTPHFGPLPDTVYLNESDGVHAVKWRGRASDHLAVQAAGPNWYFAQGLASADDLRISPDGRWALAHIAQQLHLFTMPDKAGETVNLTAPAVRHRRITDVGADFFGWSQDGRTIWWSVGSTLHRRALSGVRLDDAGTPPRAADVGGAARPLVVTVPRDTPQGTLLLRGARAITMKGDEVIPDADILIMDDHIRAIGPRGSFPVPADAAIRELAGATIVPGFIDIHDHVADIRRDVLDMHNWGPAANLAYGVTLAFDPSSLSIDMLAYEDLVDSGQMIGSRIMTTGPAVFSFNDFRSKAEVKAVLSRYRDDYRLGNIKQYRTGNRRTRQWVVEAARELGLNPTTEGALSRKLDITHIIDGFSGNEHSIPPATLHDDVLQLLARSGTSYTLTLQITHGGVPGQNYFIARDAPHGDAKYARFAPDWFRDQKFWQREWRDPGEYLFPDVAKSAARFTHMGGLLGLGAHGEVPGLGTHWEMQAYAMGGMTPLEVLRAVTIDGARAIGRDADFGSLEPGKYADLVILDRNPLDGIANTLSIRQVMKNGRLYESDTLDEIWPRKRAMPPFWFSKPRG